jgi:hypothetical protein
MGNTASQRSTTRTYKSKSRDSASTGNLTELSETKHERTKPMKLMDRKANSGGTDAKMLPSKKAATLLSPKNPTSSTKQNETNVDRRDDALLRPKFIRDEQVQVNLAMADLMAYLQVVANNSNNLPLTRRDDPELTHMVSNLTSDEYARKSAAFIPADVRVIGGSFLKYGKVWDLPTSEEYTALDGAQEPGKSSLQYCARCHLTGMTRQLTLSYLN